MKLLIHDYAGHPFPVQLSRELARRGHNILHLYAGYNQTPRGLLSRQDQDPNTFHIRGVYISRPLDKDDLFRRWRQELEYGQVLSKEIKTFHPEVVLCGNTPLDVLRRIIPATHQVDGRFLLWLQDLHGLAAQRLLQPRVPILGYLIGQYHTWLEKRFLEECDGIVTIAPQFTQVLLEWGIPAEKIVTIPNWAPINRLPVLKRRNAWAAENGLSDGFNFLYTGTLRMKHNPSLLLDLATEFQRENSPTRVVVTSEGKATRWLERQARKLGLDNLITMDFQPMERYGQVLASGDVLVAILEREAGIFSVPSKVLSYLCARRPLLLSVPPENLAAEIVTSQFAGKVVQPGASGSFLHAARELYDSPQLRERMGENARRYAEKTFDINVISDKFEWVIASV